jgi:hypothetical protein
MRARSATNRPGGPQRTLLALILAALVIANLSAHRRDEYLQAARLAIAPTRVELQLDLTPGIAVADTIIADIDRNRDGALSPDEQQAYVARVLSAIELAVDGHPVHLQPEREQGPSTFPDPEAFRRGEGTIALQANATLPPLSEGAHQLAYRNTHRADISVYLANALIPDSNRVTVTAQMRDPDQRNLTIDYQLRDASNTSFASAWLLTCIAAATLWAGFLLRASRAPARLHHNGTVNGASSANVFEQPERRQE